MPNGGMELSAWRAAVQKLSLEYDREELTKQIHQAEMLIVRRLQQLDGHDGTAERAAINGALSTIRAIQCERLGFPGLGVG